MIEPSHHDFYINKTTVKQQNGMEYNLMDNHIWGADWKQIRDQWLIDPSIAFLNHGCAA